MKEHGIILKDLQEYMKGKGVASRVEYQDWWYITFTEWHNKELYSRRFYVQDGLIHPLYPLKSIVPLADPQYKEKFYEYVKTKTGVLKNLSGINGTP